MKECPICYQQFQPKHNNQVYCSKRCTNAAYRNKKRKCLTSPKQKKDSHIPNDMMADKTAYDYFQA